MDHYLPIRMIATHIMCAFMDGHSKCHVHSAYIGMIKTKFVIGRNMQIAKWRRLKQMSDIYTDQSSCQEHLVLWELAQSPIHFFQPFKQLPQSLNLSNQQNLPRNHPWIYTLGMTISFAFAIEAEKNSF